ncbi:MAG: hypothetical protein D6726_05640 [Nitrospirae bacterium]|nr:MAG: hypothetical protein D6726_05640 [Nitrospirota bacterium]
MKNTIVFLFAVLAILAFLVFTPKKEFPPIPGDKIHMEVAVEKDCLKCHDKDKKHPMGKNHPPKFACFKCHERG